MADQKIADITASINETNQKVESSDKKLAANSMEKLIGTVQQLVDIQKETLEVAQNQAMFARFKDDDPDVGPAPSEKPEEPEEGKKPGGFMKTFGVFFKMLKGFVGILLAVAIPALAFLLNSPVFETLKKAIFDFIDFFFKDILPVLKIIKDKFFVVVDDIMKYFDENVLPVLKDVKDKLFGVLIKLYDDVIKPIYDFFEEFMTKEGGGFDILLKGLEKSFNNFKAIFDDIINIISSLIDGDLGAVKDHIFSLGANILKAVKDSIDTIIEFVLGMFGIQAKEGQGGMSMLGDVVKGFFKSIVDKISGVFDGLTKSISSVIEDIMSGIQNIARDIIGDTLGDKIFGKRAVKDLSADEKLEEQEDLRKGMEGKEEGVTDEEKDVTKAKERMKEVKESEAKKIKKIESRRKDDGTLTSSDERDLKLSEKRIAEQEKVLLAQEKDVREAKAKLEADQQRLQKINASLNAPADAPAPEKLIEAKDEEKPDGKVAKEVNKAANQNTPAGAVAMITDQSQNHRVEKKTVIEHNKILENPAPGGRAGKAIEGLH